VTSARLWRFVCQMKIALIGALMLLAAAACGAYQFPGATPSAGTGTASGHVIAVPCGPVESPSNACAGRPVPGLEIDYTNGESARQAFTDSTGAYSVELPAGTWKVRMKTYMRILSGPTAVTVAAGSQVTANYILDTGIRVPVPQQ
jgi:hypothetical protein